MANNHWRKSQTEDFFIRDSKRKGLRSRSVYKLQEIDQRFKIFKNVQSVIDIGSCPGGWSVYSRKKIKSGIILAIDINEMEPIEGVTFIQGSIDDEMTTPFQARQSRVSGASTGSDSEHQDAENDLHEVVVM